MYRVGDRLRCIKDYGSVHLEEGKTYTILEIDASMLESSPDEFYWFRVSNDSCFRFCEVHFEKIDPLPEELFHVL